MENFNLKELSKREQIQIKGGSEFTVWLVRSIGSWFGSSSNQGLGDDPWRAMEEMYGDNSLLWP
jgi:hypothetical protein